MLGVAEKRKQDWLSRYVGLKMRSDNLHERLTRLQNEREIPAMKESDGSKPTGGGRSDRMANATIRAMMYEERIRPELDKVEQEMQEIEAAVNALPDPCEVEVLTLRYIDGDYCRQLKWRTVAEIMYGTDDEATLQRVHRLHEKALRRLVVPCAASDEAGDPASKHKGRLPLNARFMR